MLISASSFSLVVVLPVELCVADCKTKTEEEEGKGQQWGNQFLPPPPPFPPPLPPPPLPPLPPPPLQKETGFFCFNTTTWECVCVEPWLRCEMRKWHQWSGGVLTDQGEEWGRQNNKPGFGLEEGGGGGNACT